MTGRGGGDPDGAASPSGNGFFAEGRNIVRYLAVGGTAAAVDLVLFLAFAQYLGLPYLRVAAATFVVSTLVNYFLSVRIVFVSGVRFRPRWEVALVFLVSGFGLGINQLILWLCVEKAALDLLVSKVTATGSVFFWNYFARRRFVFAGTRR